MFILFLLILRKSRNAKSRCLKDSEPTFLNLNARNLLSGDRLNELEKLPFSKLYTTMISPDHSSPSAIQARVVVIGDSTVGKTSLLNRLTTDLFDRSESPTIVSTFHIYRRQLDGVFIDLQIWDTAGQEQYRALGPIYYHNANAAIVVYDRSARQTFENLREWVKAFTDVVGDKAVIFVVANKCDLRNQMVETSEAMEWARKRGFLFRETSAFDGRGIEELFEELSAALVRGWAGNENESRIERETGVKGRCC
jgi:small GTP-binding protein